MMRTLLHYQTGGGVPVLAQGLGALAGLVAATTLSMTACAEAEDSDLESGAQPAAGYPYPYSGGAWQIATVDDEADDYTPMSCVPEGAYGATEEDETDDYTPMSCVPEGAYGATEEDEAAEPMTGGLPEYARSDYEPMTGGLPDYAE